MRHLLLVLLAAACSGADIETLTLTDGRVLVGEVAPKGLHGATVDLLKPKGARITISLDDIKTRAPYVEPPAAAAAPAVQVQASSSAPAKAPAGDAKALPAIVAYQRSVAEVSAAQQALQAAEKAVAVARAGAVAAWLAQADLTALPVLITEKSTPEEIHEGERRTRFNGQLAWLRSAAAMLGGRTPDRQELTELVQHASWGEFVQLKHDQVAAILYADRDRF
jgi:hypothetical protein